MMIWLTGGVLVLLAAAIGYFLGGIRASISLFGTVLGAFLAKTVGGWVAGLVPMIGFTHPVWLFYLPPVLGFLLVTLLFFGVALVVHHLVQRRLRNSTDEYTYARWARLNARTGLAVGAGLGTVWLILVGVVAYVPGYLTTQFAEDDEPSAVIRAVNGFTRGMSETGLQRIVERFRPAADEHYLASDILGLVYNNPSLHSRLASYPPFLGLAEKSEVAELARDPELNTMIQSRASLSRILEHARMRAVNDNHEIVNELLALDLQDLHQYLRTGVSEKFKGERILGRWRLNVRRSIAEMRNVGSDKLPAVEFNLLRKALNVYLDTMTVGFTTDNKVIIKVKAKDEHKLLQTVGRAASGSASAGAPVAPAGDGAPPPAVGTGSGLTARSLASRAIPQPQPTDSTADLYRQRYGTGAGGRGGTGGGGGASAGSVPTLATPGAVPVRVAARPPTTTTLGPLMSNGDGSWSKEGEDRYKLTVSGDGKDLVLDVRVRETAMVASMDGRTLVFDRI